MNSQARTWIATGAILAAVAVAIGAVGAHGLEKMIAEMNDVLKRVANWNTGFRYQMYHSIGLVIVGVMMLHTRSRLLTAAAMLMVAGIILFSGCLYGWVFLDDKMFHRIVPLGGLSFILSWLCVAAAAFSIGGPANAK